MDSRRMRSTQARAIDVATSALRASRLPWMLVFCIVMTAAAPMNMIVMAMSTSTAVKPRASLRPRSRPLPSGRRGDRFTGWGSGFIGYQR